MTGSATERHVAAVICSWNQREDTLACLESLSRMQWDRLTPIVVDNDSADGTVEAVRTAFPDAVVLESGSNLGATGGNNFGMRHALALGADYAFVLNNDTELAPDLIAELVGVAERTPDAGALCPLIYYEQPRDLIWYAGAEYEPERGYNGKMIGYRERDKGQYEGVREVGALVTCAALVPRRVLEQVGLLEESLFIQIDDFEWSLRIRDAGYRILCVSSARMWHKISAACGGEDSPTVAYYALRNTLAVNAGHAPLRGLPAFRRYALTMAAHLAHARKGEHPGKNFLAVLEGWRDFHLNRAGRRGALRG